MMMISKVLIGAAVYFLAANANSAPTLEADNYATSAVDSIGLKINGAAAIPCTLVVQTGGALVRPTCDLASITTPGTYSLIMVATKAAGCSGNTCYAGGTASSVPFSYIWKGSDVAIPVLSRLAP
jgi:hypothetical protein